MARHDQHKEWNHEIRATLEEHGDDTSLHHDITHYFYSNTFEDAQVLVERLKSASHRILISGETREHEGREQWLVLTKTVTIPMDKILDEMTDECCSLCEGLEVEYDGWETDVIRLNPGTSGDS